MQGQMNIFECFPDQPFQIGETVYFASCMTVYRGKVTAIPSKFNENYIDVDQSSHRWNIPKRKLYRTVQQAEKEIREVWCGKIDYKK